MGRDALRCATLCFLSQSLRARDKNKLSHKLQFNLRFTFATPPPARCLSISLCVCLCCLHSGNSLSNHAPSPQPPLFWVILKYLATYFGCRCPLRRCRQRCLTPRPRTRPPPRSPVCCILLSKLAAARAVRVCVCVENLWHCNCKYN